MIERPVCKVTFLSVVSKIPDDVVKTATDQLQLAEIVTSREIVTKKCRAKT